MTTSSTNSTTRRLGGALLALGLMLGAGDARAQTTPTAQTLTAVKDSFLRSGAADRNEGANPGLRIQASGHNRVVVAFDPDAIEAFLAANTLTTATLVLTIAENADNWGREGDRTVDAHPLTTDFAEGDGQNAGVPGSESTRGSGAGVTWHCAEDAEIANQATDCDPRWDGGSFGMANAPSVLHVNGLSGEVSWDVTEDVAAGATAWLIKKTAEGQAGQVFYYSKEGAEAAGDPDLAPRLVLEGPEALPCGGATSKCVFVTSTIATGNLGGLAGADGICQTRAGASGSLAAPGTYLAWLSDNTASPSTRFTQASVPYKRVDGTTIADDWSDLTDGSLDVPIAIDEAGTSRDSLILTATQENGTSPGFSTCTNWTTGAGATDGGRSSLSDRNWTVGLTMNCNGGTRLYCFQQ
jgi:hypothetical protein